MHCDLSVNTMMELLVRQAADHGDRTAYIFLDDRGEETAISYRELDERARSIAAHLQTQLSPGDRAMLVYPAGLEFVAAFFGCLYADVVAVPATYPKPRRPLPRMNRIAADCGAHVALTSVQTLETIDRDQVDADVGRLDWIATDSISTGMAQKWRRPEIDEGHLAFLQYTSGSTSDPKGVMVTHGNLLNNLEAIRQAFGVGEVEEDHIAATGVFWLPAYHDMGLIGGILTPLYVGGRSVLMSPTAFLQRPIRWLQAIDKYQATISGAPNFAYEMSVKRTTAEEREGLDLRLWRLAFCGAEPIRAETIEHFTETYGPAGFAAEALYPCYGLAESTLLAAGPKFDEPPCITAFHRQELAEHRVVPGDDLPREQVQRLVGCGRVIEGHELIVVDPASSVPVEDGTVGEILLRGPSLAQGYWNRMEETRKVFHAEVPGHGKHFLRTGDLGFMHDGQLYVTGRVKDVIIIRGRNHYPQDIEQTVEQAHPAILPGAAFSMQVDDTEQLAVVHQVDRQSRGEDWEKVASSVRRAIVANHDLDPQRIVFIRQTSLPITSSGKVQRSLCRQQLIADELKVVHDWTAPQRTASRNGDHDQSATTNGSANGHVANGRANGNGKGSVEINVSGDGVSWKQNGNGHAAAPSTPTSGSQARAALNGLHTDRAAERIESWLLQWLVERVGLDPVDVDRTKPFAEFGVDSVTSVELSQELEDEFGIELTPVVAWNHPTPAALSRYLAEQIATVNSAINGAVTNGAVTNGSTLNGSAGSRRHHHTNGHHLGNGSTNGAANRMADDDLQKMLAEVENLSDDEVARLLAEED